MLRNRIDASPYSEGTYHHKLTFEINCQWAQWRKYLFHTKVARNKRAPDALICELNR